MRCLPAGEHRLPCALLLRPAVGPSLLQGGLLPGGCGRELEMELHGRHHWDSARQAAG